MKKYFLLIISLYGVVSCRGDNIVISVSNYAFTPNAVRAYVGDVIEFHWSEGSHTATAGLSLPGTMLPPGAAPFNAILDAAHPAFFYTITTNGSYLYGSAPSWAGGAGMKGVIEVSGAAPVSFGNFSCTLLREVVKIKWTTFNEQYTDYFSIRRSSNGINFTEVYRQKAAGFSNSLLNYTIDDDLSDINGNIFYYQISTFDLDRRETRTEVRVVRKNMNNSSFITVCSAGPYTSQSAVKFTAEAGEDEALQTIIYNSRGSRIADFHFVLQQGINNGQLQLPYLSPGIYYLVFLKNSSTNRKAIVLIK